jgi:hypothetical protein
MVSVLRQRDFGLLWTGQTVSELGSAVTLVAFPLVAVGVLHASNFAVGVITASSTAAWLLFGLPAGCGWTGGRGAAGTVDLAAKVDDRRCIATGRATREEFGYRGSNSTAWAILGSNQWPLRCERSALPLS